MLIAGLLVGITVSILQTVTSIQDNILAFIPRAAAIFIVFAVTFPWMLRIVTGFAATLFRAAARTRADERIRVVRRPGLLLVRPGMIVMATPFLGALNAPVQMRVGLTVLLALLAGRRVRRCQSRCPPPASLSSSCANGHRARDRDGGARAARRRGVRGPLSWAIKSASRSVP